MSTVKFVNINKVYGNNFHAVYDFNLDVADKEFIVFVGPSGCGKSTTLRMIAGLEEVTDGEIYIDNVLINEVAPKDRNIAMVFQSYALYPHMTVFDNMAFSLLLRKEKFPVMRVDTTNPDFIKEEDEITKTNQKELEEGIAQIEAESKDIPRKVKKEKIKDFSYRQDKKFKAEMDKLKEKYSSQVMTYDREAVKKLNEEIAALRKAEVVDEAKIADKQKEIEKIRSTLNTPEFEVRHFTKEEMARKVSAAAETLGLEPYLKRKPAALSGGQRQRVALGRAIVRNPKVFLMDEPLSNLDAKLRVQMRSEIAKIHQKVGATTIYVTHDQTEAMTMASRIVCMKDGWVQQIGTPKELFNTPSNMFVAGFIGAPAMNFIKGKYDGKLFTEENGVFSIDVGADQKKKLKDYVGKEVILGVRPEDMYLAADKKGETYSNPIALTCDISELLGRELVIYSYVGDQRIIIKVNTRDDIVSGIEEKYVLDLTRIHFFDPETTNRIK